MIMFLLGLINPEARRGAKRARSWFMGKFPRREVESVELVARQPASLVFRLYFQHHGAQAIPSPYMVVVVSRTSEDIGQSEDPQFFKRNYM